MGTAAVGAATSIISGLLGLIGYMQARGNGSGAETYVLLLAVAAALSYYAVSHYLATGQTH